MKELLKKLRRYEIQIRKLVNNQMQGDFHSVFKGSGLEFDDVRPYQYGDDIRAIDWNVSAKGHGTFVKTFREEKEQTIYFLVDISASQNIGSAGKTKADIAKEICGVLTLSGIKESAQIGLIAFSNQREIFLRPKKGMAQAHLVIHSLFTHKPTSTQTSLSSLFSFALQVIKRRSIIIVVSDFIDEGYDVHLKTLAKKHDVVLIRVVDNREVNLPKLGIISVKDQETQTTHWVNTSLGNFNQLFTGIHQKRSERLTDFARKHQLNLVHINTQEDYVPRLLQLFKVRNKTRKSA